MNLSNTVILSIVSLLSCQIHTWARDCDFSGSDELYDEEELFSLVEDSNGELDRGEFDELVDRINELPTRKYDVDSDCKLDIEVVISELPHSDPSWSQIQDFVSATAQPSIKFTFDDLDKDLSQSITFEEFIKALDNNETANQGLLSRRELAAKIEPVQRVRLPLGLQQSFLSGDSAFSPLLPSDKFAGDDPAQFQYTFDAGEDIFSIDAALLFKVFPDGELDISDSWTFGYLAIPVLEAHVSSKDDAPNNSLLFHIPFVFDFTHTPEIEAIEENKPLIGSHIIISSPRYESDRDFETEVVGFDLLYTLNPNLDIGIGSPVGGSGPIQFRWRPFVGLEFSQVLDDGDRLKTLPVDSILRATGRIRAELDVLKSFVLSTDYIYRFDVTGENDSFNYLDISGTFFLSEDRKTSIITSYTVGQNSPRFDQADKLSVAFGVRF